MQAAKVQGAKIASAYNASATGTNLIAQNLGSGVAGELTPLLGKSNLTLGPAAFALATGIGNATVYGLNLTQQKTSPLTEPSIEAIAGNLGLGNTLPIVSNIDLQAVMRSFGGTKASSLAQQLPSIAAAAGQGFGEGAKTGLGLTINRSDSVRKRQLRTDSSNPLAGVDIPVTVSSFTKGLSQSFLTGSDLNKLNPFANMNLTGMTDICAMLRPLAAGAGAGVGMGLAVGLKLKPVDSQATFGANVTGQDEQSALIAERFVQNVLSNFLINSTALQQAKTLLLSGQSPPLNGIDVAKAAEGFARGTIEGVVSAMASVGGVKNLISGQVPANAFDDVPVLQPSRFDDTVNGSAVGFARGFTGTGTILAPEIIRNLTEVMQSLNGASSRQRRDTVTEANMGAEGKIQPPAITLDRY
jgi:hypothetical protein